MFLLTINAIAPIFLILGLGYWCGYRKTADSEDLGVLNVFVMRFALPASLLSATWHTPISGFVREMPIIAVLVITMWILWAAVYFMARRLFNKEPAKAAIYALTISLPNYAALGFPILSTTLGQELNPGLNVAISIACGSIFLSPLTLIVLEREMNEQYKEASTTSLLIPLLIKALKNPIVMWPIIGTFLACLGIKMPDLLTHSLTPLASAGAGGALFLTGLILSARKLQLSKAVVIGFLLKNLVQPILGFFIAISLGVSANTAITAVYLTALATGFFGVMFGNSFGVYDEDSESTLLVSTVLFALTIPLFIFYFG